MMAHATNSLKTRPGGEGGRGDARMGARQTDGENGRDGEAMKRRAG